MYILLYMYMIFTCINVSFLYNCWKMCIYIYKAHIKPWITSSAYQSLAPNQRYQQTSVRRFQDRVEKKTPAQGTCNIYIHMIYIYIYWYKKYNIYIQIVHQKGDYKFCINVSSINLQSSPNMFLTKPEKTCFQQPKKLIWKLVTLNFW